MSGGSYEYFYARIEEMAGRIREVPGECVIRDGRTSASLRRAFADHLYKVAKAFRAIEWNDSGDGDDDEGELIRAVVSPTAELEHAIKSAEESMKELGGAIYSATSLLEKVK